jgi:hypothetical protein
MNTRPSRAVSVSGSSGCERIRVAQAAVLDGDTIDAQLRGRGRGVDRLRGLRAAETFPVALAIGALLEADVGAADGHGADLEFAAQQR